jgi:GAF domain-containing protein
MKGFSIRTISGRFIFMSALFLGVMASLTAYIAIQSKNSQDSLRIIRDVRVPIRLVTGDLMGSLDRVMSQQRAYMLSGNANFKKERSAVYAEEIYPALEKLLLLKTELPEAHRKSVDVIQQNVKDFAGVQGEILSYFEANMLPHMQHLSQADSDTWVELGNSFLAKLQAEREVSERIKVADEIRYNLLQVVAELRNSQQELLANEIALTVAGMFQTRMILVSLSALLLLFLMLYTVLTIRSLRHSIQKPVALINELASGAIPEKMETTTDELNEIMQAGHRLTNNIQLASKFALAIGEGRLHEQYTEVGDKDVLGKSLLHMRNRLQSFALAEQKRNWATSGMAQLGNILRTDNNNTEQLYLNVLSFLINYLKANQGGLYMVEERDGEATLNLVSCYAYQKKKYIQHQVSAGEGLIGQVYLEKEMLFIKEVPKDYIKITSGLGEALPRSVLICPLVLNSEVFGIVELASFSEFEVHEQDFVKLAAEQVAAVVATVKNNEKTSSLLKESQYQTEQLRAQEEEMRQNMEELSATQEEMARKEREYMNRIKILEESFVASAKRVTMPV